MVPSGSGTSKSVSHVAWMAPTSARLGRRRPRRLLLVIVRNVNDKAVLGGPCAFVVNGYEFTILPIPLDGPRNDGHMRCARSTGTLNLWLFLAEFLERNPCGVLNACVRRFEQLPQHGFRRAVFQQAKRRDRPGSKRCGSFFLHRQGP